MKPFDFGVLYECPICGGRGLSSSAAYPGMHWLYDEEAGINSLCGPLTVPASDDGRAEVKA